MVGKALGVKTELQQITGANRIPFLLTDKVDVVISVMGLTPERAKQITFSAPYANTFLAVYGAKVRRGGFGGEAWLAPGRSSQGHDPGARDHRDEPTWPPSCAPRTTRPPQRPTYPARPIFSRRTASWPRRSPSRTPRRNSSGSSSSAAPRPTWACAWASINLVRWLDGFIFFSTMNGELDRLHRKYLDMPMDPLPTL